MQYLWCKDFVENFDHVASMVYRYVEEFKSVQL
jgi:hypothetical protein